MQILLFLFPWPLLVYGGIRSSELPQMLNDCLKTRSQEDTTVSDEEISTSCMLHFMWLTGEQCDHVSRVTVDWLSSLVKKSSKTEHRQPEIELSAPPLKTFQSNVKISMKTQAAVEVSGHTNLKLPPSRKEYRMLSDQERRDYHDAINAMKKDTSVAPNKYDALVKYHETASKAAHGGPAFLAWHRYYLVLYELALQEQNPLVMLPYWDSTLDFEMADPTDSVIWTSEFLGNGRGSIANGPFASWSYNDKQLFRSVGTYGKLINRNKINDLVKTKKGHTYFVEALEQEHNGVHVWVGGNMGSIFHSPSDPVFFMHHAFIDCVWEEYRIRQIQLGNDPTKYPHVRPFQKPHHNSNMDMQLPLLFNETQQNKDGYQNFWTEQFYTCESTPWCSNAKPDCGSKWLQCDLFFKRCVSKSSMAVQPEVTPERVLQIAQMVAPEAVEAVQLEPNNRRMILAAAPSNVIPNKVSSIILDTVPDAVTESAREFTAQEFFKLLNSLSEQKSSPKRIFKRAANIIRQPISLVANKTIEDFKIPEKEEPCKGFPTQNTFLLDCQADTSLWVFVPIKVVRLRYGNIIYDSHPVNEQGQMIESIDIFSFGNQLSFSSNIPLKSYSENSRCVPDQSGLTKVKVATYGLNYRGFYEDSVFLDNRQSVSSAVSYVAIKKPEYEGSNIFVTAMDECGIVCQPMIIKKQRTSGVPVYKKFTGAAWITADNPVYYSSTYRGAEALVWKGKTIPIEDNNQIPIVFYCNYAIKHPWF